MTFSRIKRIITIRVFEEHKFMVCRELFQEIDGMNEEYLKIWADVCNIESPTQSKAGVDAVGSYFVKMAQREDFEVEIFPPNVFASFVGEEYLSPGPESHPFIVHPSNVISIRFEALLKLNA